MRYDTLRQLEINFDARPLALLSPDEIYDTAGATLVVALGEDRRIDRKAPQIQPRDLGEYLSMWSNTQPDGGLIALGVGNEGEIVGCKALDQSRLNQLEAVGSLYCPDAKLVSKRVQVINVQGEEDFIVLFRTYYNKSKVVRTSSGKAFVRTGDRKEQLSDSAIRELEIDKGQIDHELDAAPYKYPQDFDQQLLETFARNWRASRDLETKPLPEILRLCHLGEVVDGDFHPNVACALLFAKDPTRHFPGCKIRFLRFDGEAEGQGSQWNAIKDVLIDGLPVPRLIESCAAVIESQLRTFSRLGPDGVFYTAAEYPKEAWYEALVNACVHRSYSLKNMNIFIRMFDDRIEIESPGGFPPLVTPENIYDTHQPRNPRFMDALRYLEFVKCAHEGARRMRTRMTEMSLPLPQFHQRLGDHANVRVVLQNNIKHRRVWVDADVKDIVSATILQELTEQDRRAINFVAEHGRITVSQMTRLTGLSWQTAKNRLLRLRTMRILDHHVRTLTGTTGRDSTAHFTLRKGNGGRQ